MSGIDQLSPAQWARINAIGSSVITSITIAASVYLFVVLSRQGRGKLRVRLLLGMVISDFLLGMSVLPQEIIAAAGKPTQTGTKSCDVAGFFFTAILFTQHLWTALIAIATYVLLKHPLSRFTTLLDRYSWTCWLLIWGISFLHSGIWWATSGFSSTGTLCYYAPRNDSFNMVDPRDLIQFIPRAIVFLVIIVLYTQLFRFLRRPDTITLSDDLLGANSLDAQMVSTDTERSVMYNPFGKMAAKLGGHKPPPVPTQKGFIGPEGPPWETLDFVTVGRGATSQRTGTSAAKDSVLPGPMDPTFVGGSLIESGPGPTPNGESLPWLSSPPSSIRPGGNPSWTGTPTTKPRTPALVPGEESGPGSRRKSSVPDMSSDTSGSKRASDAETLQTPKSANAPLAIVFAAEHARLHPTHDHSVVHILEPTVSAGSMDKHESGPGQPSPALTALPLYPHPVVRRPPSPEDDDGDGTGRGETLAEFFDATTDAEARSHRGSSAGQQISATAYFNRQASILMLWFPITYLFVFSVSLARLIYDMVVDGPPNQLFLLISAWFVLSVGFVDAIVYGLAEYVVKRRVQKQIPDRMT